MIAGISSSIAAIYAFGSKLAGTANNIANVNTDGYKKTVSTISEGKQGLPETNQGKSSTPGPIVQVEGLFKETSNVDLAEEFPQMVLAQRGYEANIKSLQTQAELTKLLMDIIV